MNIDNAQKFLIESGKSDLAGMLFYDTETKTSHQLMATLLEEYHQSEVLKLPKHPVSFSFPTSNDMKAQTDKITKEYDGDYPDLIKEGFEMCYDWIKENNTNES